MEILNERRFTRSVTNNAILAPAAVSYLSPAQIIIIVAARTRRYARPECFIAGYAKCTRNLPVRRRLPPPVPHARSEFSLSAASRTCVHFCGRRSANENVRKTDTPATQLLAG